MYWRLPDVDLPYIVLVALFFVCCRKLSTGIVKEPALPWLKRRLGANVLRPRLSEIDIVGLPI